MNWAAANSWAAGFSNLQSNAYWSATEYAPNTVNAWYFDTSGGCQGAAQRVDGGVIRSML